MKYFLFIAITIFFMNCKSPTASNATSDNSEPITTNSDNFIENNPSALVSKTYQVTQLKDGDALYAFSKTQPKVTFGEEGKLSTKLSANRCGGNYEADNKKISFSADACTEMCCDSKEDMVFQGVLSKGTFNYQMTATDLILTKEDKLIRLQLVD